MEEELFAYLERFIDLNDDEKHAIRDLSIFYSFPKGSILLREGERSNKAFFVIRGCLRVYYVLDGEERTTEFYTEMQGLTPSCVLDKQPSAYYVACVEDSLVLCSDPEMEMEIFSQFPKFETLCRVMSEQLLIKQQVSFDAFKTSSPEQRYQHLLTHRPELLQRIPQYQLASYLGIQPQSLSRLRARLLSREK